MPRSPETAAPQEDQRWETVFYSAPAQRCKQQANALLRQDDFDAVGEILIKNWVS